LIPARAAHSRTKGIKRLNILSQVLLVDDNPGQLKIRETVLRNAGLEVCVAMTAESALAALSALQGSVGVVVADHMMPECSGAELVQQIRGSGNWVPVIILSGLVEAEAEYQGLEVVFRVKPIPPLELVELVRSSLSRPPECRGAA
jgi:DNA-binding response OmpR family regulator